MSTISIGPVRCPRGEKARGYVPAVSRVDGTELGIPVLVVNGAKDGPVFLADGGIHGDEQEGTLAILELARELDPRSLRGAFVGVPVMNVGGFEAMSRGNPRDEHTYDMNRIYPGKAGGYLTDRIACVHDEKIGALADLEITIHSGGNICYLGETIFTARGDEKGFELARAMGEEWRILLDTPHPVGSPMAAMVGRGKAAITVELGGSAALMPDVLKGNVETLKRALANVARHYGMLDGVATYASEAWRGSQIAVMAGKSGILRPNDELPSKKLKKPIVKDEVLLTLTDFFGDIVEELRAPATGVLFGFRTYPSTTAGDWTLFCGDAELGPLP
jgi:predicted deacylase